MMPYALKFPGPKQLLSPLYGVTLLLLTLMTYFILLTASATMGARYIAREDARDLSRRVRRRPTHFRRST
jgi:hypothetical protein